MQLWQPIDRIPVIPVGEIAVFRCALAGRLAELDALRGSLAASERERLERFQSEPAAIAFLQTRVLTRRALAVTLACDIEEVILAPNASGKPEITSPVNPGLAFNATHTRGWGGVVIANIPGCEIGLDFEVHNAARDISALAGRHYSVQEQLLLDAQPDEEARLRTFFDIWTAKEACIKATGKGLATDLRGLNLAGLLDESQEHTDPLLRSPRPVDIALRRIAMPAYYSGAIAWTCVGGEDLCTHSESPSERDSTWNARLGALNRVRLFDCAIYPGGDGDG